MGRLQGKVAIVTGGAAGLGLAISELYAEEGASVVICDLRQEAGEQAADGIRTCGGEALFVRCDVTDGAQVQELIQATERRFGALHIMTANAGIMGRGIGKTLPEMSEEEFAEVMDVNVLGVMLSFKHAIPAILRSGGGAMTATTSLAAHRGHPKLPAYCTSKAAVTGLVRSVATDLLPDIRVNAVSPGSMSTDLGANTLALGVDPRRLEGLILPFTGREAFGRVSDAREVAMVHLFLVSSESSFMTGQVLLVDNGRSVLQT